MAERAYLPVGTEDDNKKILIVKGDVLRLVSTEPGQLGKKITFTEMKRVNFHGKIDGRPTRVPIWRNGSKTKPFIAEKLNERDESVITVSADVLGFTAGDLFALEGSKETFMYKRQEQKGRRQVVKAIDVATGRPWAVDVDNTFIKIDLEERKEKIEQ
jgi:hypothetical protein